MAQGSVPPDLPVLVVWGVGDTFLPASNAERQKEVFPRAEVHLLEGCGHWPFVDDPDAVRTLLVKVLREHAGTCPDPRGA